MERHRIARRTWAAPLLACLLCPRPGPAQADGWERLQIINPGRRVEVRLRAAKPVKGKLEGWRPDGLTVQQGNKKVVSLQKSEIAQVALVIGRSRGRKAMLAGLIAAGAVGAITGAAYSSNGCCVSPAIVPAAAGFWGVVAAGIAALFPPHREVIYRAAPAPVTTSRPQ